MHFDRSSETNVYDVDFSVPMTHRLRFTVDCFGDEFGVLRDLIEPNAANPARCQVWIDEGVLAAYPSLSASIEGQLAKAPEIALASPVDRLIGGEQVKNDPGIVNRLLRSFDDDGLDRRSYVIVIGGGAVLDAVGYAAAVAHRGLRLIRFPSTTLSQSDSGVGVKNAVNWFGKKNWKGTFATPWAVVNDYALLEGLDDRDFCCGFSEAVKVALLKDPEFFAYLHENAAAIAGREAGPAQHALKQSVLWHLDHITRGGDPYEALQARPLDFGHWSAHKLEAVTEYRLRHGEAVSIGVAVDTAYSFLTEHLPLSTAEATFATLRGLGLPIWDSALNSDLLFEGLEEFRQHLGGDLTITMLRDVGRSTDVHSIKVGAMREAIEMVGYYAGVDLHSEQMQ